jgi:radical SAM superfamily enzyme YgiQ (UPF0313 family)
MTSYFLIMNEKNRVQLLLIDPFSLRYKKISFKLGLGYLASYVSKFGYKTLIIKYQSFNEIKDIIKNKDPKVVGITGLTNEFQRVIQIAKRIKKLKNDIVIVFGGPHASFCRLDYKKILKDIDIIVKNEGEYTLKEILDYVYKKPKRKKLHQIKGIIFSKKNKVIETENRPLIKNLNKLPFPIRDYDAIIQEIMCLRGCFFRCKFCLWYKYLGGVVRYRSPENVVKEIKTILHKTPKSIFYFIDSTLTVSENYLQEICKKMIKEKIKFNDNAQIYGNISNLSTKVLKLLKKVGIQFIYFGIESGSPTIREISGKKFSNEDIIRCFNKVSSHNLVPIAGFCIGLPNESKESIFESLKLALKLYFNVRKVFFSFLSFKPYPGTEFYENLKNYNCIITDKDFNRWNEKYIVVKTSRIDEKTLSSYLWSFHVIFSILQLNYFFRWNPWFIKIFRIILWPFRIGLKMCPFNVVKYYFLFLAKFYIIIKSIFGVKDNAINLSKFKKF